MPDKHFENFHAEEISSVLVYDFRKFQLDSANLAYLTGRQKQFNTTVGRHYSSLIWTRFPSFIHIFPEQTNEEVYDCQFRFLLSSGLGLITRPKITSVIITLENSTVHQINGTHLFRKLGNKNLVELSVDYYDFALYLKCTDTKSFSCNLFEISSVSVLKFCTDCFVASKVSLVHFEICKKSPLNAQQIDFNCINKTSQIVSETSLNLSRFGIELEAYDLEGHQTYESCISQTILKNDIILPFSNHLKDGPVQNVLLEEHVRGLPVLNNCVMKEQRDLMIVNLVFSPQDNTRNDMYYEFQARSSLQNQEAFNFLTCDGVNNEVGFMGYLAPFDAQTWSATISSLLLYSSLMVILASHSTNTSFIDSCLSSALMNLSFLTGVANAPLKLIVNSQRDTIRILMFSCGITTIVLCSLYSSLVTTSVIPPKVIVSPWNEYKQLEKFTKVFGLTNHQEMLEMDGANVRIGRQIQSLE
jgi:hypothetical protein